MMKRLLPVVIAASAMMATPVEAVPARYFSINSKGSITYWNPDGSKELSENRVSQRFNSPARSIEIATTGTPKYFDIELVYDESVMQCDAVVAGRVDAGLTIQNPQKSLPNTKIPSGCDGIIAVFQKYDPITRVTDFYVVAKDITNLANRSKIILDVADCVHKVDYAPVDKNGHELSLEVTDEATREVLEEGDFQHGFCNITWAHVNDGDMWFANLWYGKKKDVNGIVRYMRPGSIWFNDCGSDFSMGHYITCAPTKGRDYTIIEMPVYVGSDSTEPSEVVLGNDPARFKEYSRKWKRSPFSVASYSELNFAAQVAIRTGETAPNIIGGTITSPCTEEEVETRMTVCANDPDLAGSDRMGMILMDLMPEDDTDGQSGQASMWWYPGENGREYVCVNHQGAQSIEAPFENWISFAEGYYNKWLFLKDSSNHRLSFNEDQIDGIFGNNCPIISLRQADPGYDSDWVQFYYGLVGRYGESNLSASETLMDYKNSFHFDDKTQRPVGEYDENNQRKETLRYENILIDDEIEGCVTAELTFSKGKDFVDDIMPPVLTFLRIRDFNNKFTDRLATPEDGIIEFYAADFHESLDWELGKYNLVTYAHNELKRDNVKVEYSPYGKNNYKELQCTQIPRMAWYPGWGEYFSVPLSNATAKSPNCWFDLRITLEDETGNRHVQTISPAFKILNSLGIDGITEDYGNDTVYYDLMGRRVENPSNGIFIEVRGSSTRKVVK